MSRHMHQPLTGVWGKCPFYKYWFRNVLWRIDYFEVMEWIKERAFDQKYEKWKILELGSELHFQSDILRSVNRPLDPPIQPWAGGSGTGRPSQASSADFHLGQGAAHLLHLLHLNRNCWPRKSGSKVARAELELALSLNLHQGLLWQINILGLEQLKLGWGSWLNTV